MSAKALIELAAGAFIREPWNLAKRDSPERRREILAATLRVMRTHGPEGTTTQRVAAQANCSKETIYNWFGDRTGLLSALVNEQSQAMNAMLQSALGDEKGDEQDLERALVKFAAALLDLLTGEASVLINRMAIGQIGNDDQVAAVLLENGRETTAPLVIALLEKARSEIFLGFEDAGEVFSTLFGLIMGERQIRALLSSGDARPDGAQMNAIAERAVRQLQMIYPPAK